MQSSSHLEQCLKPPELLGDSLLKFTYFRIQYSIKMYIFLEFLFQTLVVQTVSWGPTKFCLHLWHLPQLHTPLGMQVVTGTVASSLSRPRDEGRGQVVELGGEPGLMFMPINTS